MPYELSSRFRPLQLAFNLRVPNRGAAFHPFLSGCLSCSDAAVAVVISLVADFSIAMSSLGKVAIELRSGWSIMRRYMLFCSPRECIHLSPSHLVPLLTDDDNGDNDETKGGLICASTSISKVCLLISAFQVVTSRCARVESKRERDGVSAPLQVFLPLYLADCLGEANFRLSKRATFLTLVSHIYIYMTKNQPEKTLRA